MSQNEPDQTDNTVVSFGSPMGSPKTVDSRPAENLIGTIFAQKYEILNLLGTGGMSSVYKARHVVMNKIHAVKILHMHLVHDNSTLRRFMQEARAASNLNHPGIVTVHDCGEGDGMPYLIMDYVEGKSLAEVLKEDGPLPEAKFLSIMQQVSAALAHAHEAGVIHRDLKPSNIMITKNREQAKVVDFGIAKLIKESAEEAQQLTQTGDVFGSPLYMSPEQCSGDPVDRRADIYSLGCVMFELLSGKPPFKGGTVVETIFKHMNVPPPEMQAAQLEGESKQRLELIILRCLAKDPADRYQTMGEIESELRSLSLKSKAGVFKSLGKAWELASAKRRAKKKSHLPVLIAAFTASMLSVGLLGVGLKQADADMAKLDHSRETVDKVADAESCFLILAERTRKYMAALLMHENRVNRAKKEFDEAAADINRSLDDVDLFLRNEPSWKKYLHVLKEDLRGAPDVVRVSADEMESAAAAGLTMNPASIGIMNKLSRVCEDGEIVLQKMSNKARKIEFDDLTQFKKTQQWLKILTIGFALWNGAIMLAFLIYFAKGTPQRLKKLAENAALLSHRRGLSHASSSEDEVADLDNVLQDLATALSEAEEREKMLLQKIRNQSELDSESTQIDIKSKNVQKT